MKIISIAALCAVVGSTCILALMYYALKNNETSCPVKAEYVINLVDQEIAEVYSVGGDTVYVVKIDSIVEVIWSDNI